MRQATDLKDEKEIAEEEEKDKEAGVGEIGNGTENGVEEDLQNGGDEITVRAPKREKIAAARCRNYDREKHQKKKVAVCIFGRLLAPFSMFLLYIARFYDFSHSCYWFYGAESQTCTFCHWRTKSPFSCRNSSIAGKFSFNGGNFLFQLNYFISCYFHFLLANHLHLS